MSEAFSWRDQKEKTGKKLYQRCIQLASCNEQWGIQHPELKKEILNKAVIKKVELQKFIDKQLELKFKYGEIPKSTIVPKRYNRVV